MGRTLSIEGLRGALMVWIVLYHYTCQYNTISEIHEIFFPLTFPTGGVYGVMMFFVISGYFIQNSLVSAGGGAKVLLNSL